MVVVAVQAHQDEVEVAAPDVAPIEVRRDRIAVVERRPDVDRGIVIGDTEIGALRPRLALCGVLLDELSDRGRVRPDRLIEPPIHIDFGLRPDSPRPGSLIVVVFGTGWPFLNCVGVALPGPGLSIQAQRSRKQDEG